MKTAQVASRGVHGAAAGVAATSVMSLFMVAWRTVLGGGSFGPAVVTDRSLGAADLLPPKGAPRAAVQTGAHVAFGGFLGAAYALAAPSAARALPTAGRGRAVGRGALYGVGVWVATYGSTLPALRLTPPPSQDRPRRQPRLLAAHLVYGATLGRLCDR